MISALKTNFSALTLGIFLVAAPAAAEPTADELQEAATFIRQLADDTIESLQRTEEGRIIDPDRIEELLDRGFEVQRISRYVVGRHWKKASRDQRDEYSSLFRDFVIDVIIQRLELFTSAELEITGQYAAGKRDIFVASKVIRKQGNIDVDWRVRKFGKAYRIIDLKVAGVSMVITYREDFGAVIQSKGFEGLIQRLREKTIETKPLVLDLA